MSEELKPCPFCGGEAVLHHGRDLETGAIVHVARCVDSPDCGSGPFTRLSAETISVWNTRAPSEREAIVKWLREWAKDTYWGEPVSSALHVAADNIELGEHMEVKP